MSQAKQDFYTIVGVIAAIAAFCIGVILLTKGQLLVGFGIMTSTTAAVYLTDSLLERLDPRGEK